MLRPIRTTQLVPFVCLFDASIALKKGVENPRAPQWVHRDDASIESVGADASIAWVHLLNDQECREWQARIGAESVDSQAVARDLARVKCAGSRARPRARSRSPSFRSSRRPPWAWRSSTPLCWSRTLDERSAPSNRLGRSRIRIGRPVCREWLRSEGSARG